MRAPGFNPESLNLKRRACPSGQAHQPHPWDVPGERDQVRWCIGLPSSTQDERSLIPPSTTSSPCRWVRVGSVECDPEQPAYLHCSACKEHYAQPPAGRVPPSERIPPDPARDAILTDTPMAIDSELWEESWKITTQARRIARWSNEYGEPGCVAAYDAEGSFIEWVAGYYSGATLTPAALAEGLVLYRTSHGKDRQADVQREIDEQRSPA